MFDRLPSRIVPGFAVFIVLVTWILMIPAEHAGLLDAAAAGCGSCDGDCSDETDSCDVCPQCVCCNMTNFVAAFGSAGAIRRPLMSIPVFVRDDSMTFSTPAPVFRPPKTSA